MNFFGGFYKAAAGDSEKKEHKGGGVAHAVRSLGAGIGGGILANTMMAPLAMGVVHAKGDAKENKKFIKNFIKHHGLKVDVSHDAHTMGPHWRPAFMGSGKAPKIKFTPGKIFPEIINHKVKPHGTVVFPKDTAIGIAAHELGHAHHLRDVSKARLAVSRVSPLAGLALGAGLASSEDKDKRKWVPAAMAGGFAPMLYEEGRATFHGTKDIARQLGKMKALKSLRHTVPAFATYASLPVGAYLGSKLVSKRFDKENS